MELVPLSPPEPRRTEQPALSPAIHGDAAPPARPARIEVDVFLAQAATEYRQGRVDQALWEATAAQFDGDKQRTVAAYLRVRARALKQKRSEDDARTAKPASPAGARSPGLIARPRVRYGLAALAIGFVVVLCAWVAFPEASPPEGQVAALNPVKPVAAKAPQAKPASITAVAPSSGRTEAVLELETKVRSLENAGNWNVLVLYAAEWTRKEPASAPAWTALSGGYRRLGQLDDALDSANRAVKLAPTDFHALRNLGNVEAALERFPEARIAFDKALAVNAEDADALCGAARVAGAQARAKEAAELTARVARTGTRCEDTSEAVRAAVYAGAPRKTPAPAR